MPANGVLDIDVAHLRESRCISLPAYRVTIVAPVDHPAVCVLAKGSQTIPFPTAEVPMPAGGVR